MGLKFRRGSTAQQSGSLAFGEPYVNTTLGTLVVGGATGDIVLSAGGTGSTGNFGAISGSGLDITGNANIAGNLTLGGAITIGDASADTVNVIASLSSSLIPQTTNAFDLGSETKVWRDLYISTGSIKFIDNGNVVGTLSTTANGLNFGSNITMGTGRDNGSTLFTIGRRDSTNIDTNIVMGINALGSGVSITGVHNTAIGDKAGYTFSTGSYNIMVGWQAGTNFGNGGAERNVIVGNQSALQLAKYSGSIPEANTFIGDMAGGFVWTGIYNTAMGAGALYGYPGQINQFKRNTAVGSYTALNVRGISNNNIYIGNQAGPNTMTQQSYKFYVGNGDTDQQPYMYGDMSNTTRSLDINASLTTSGSIIPQTSNAFDLGSADKIWRDLYISTGSIKFIGAGNAVVSTLSATSLNSNTASIDLLNTFTGSANGRLTNLESTTASLNTSVSNLNTATSSYETKGRSIVSGSSQITYASISSIPAGIVSGSSQITYASISSIPAGIVSGSSQVVGSSITTNTVTVGSTAIALGGTATTIAGLTSVTSTGFTGALTGNASTATTAAALTNARTINGTSFDGSANITIPNLVSGSAQVTLSSTTGGTTASNVQFNSLGIGMVASATAGRIDAANDVVAFSTSDIRLKENIKPIENALDKISKISGNTYDWKVELKDVHGYEGNDVGVIAQEVEAVLPQLVQDRDNGYKAVKYDKLVALLIEGIKEQQTQIHSLTIEIEKLKESKGL